jgi:hypothetical protein
MQNLLKVLSDGTEDYVFELLLDITNIIANSVNTHHLKV